MDLDDNNRGLSNNLDDNNRGLSNNLDDNNRRLSNNQDDNNRGLSNNLDKYQVNDQLNILYKLRVIKIGWLNEQMYHKLLKKEKIVNIVIHVIQGVVFLLNGIASAIGSEIDYRWWTITTAVIAVFATYINKMKDDTAYGSKIELHRSMTDECMKFTDTISDNIAERYESLVEKSSKLHIDPEVYDNWSIEFKKRGIKEADAFDMSQDLTTQLESRRIANQDENNRRIANQDENNRRIANQDENKIDIFSSPRKNNPPTTIVTAQSKNKKADFELQRLFQNLNIKIDDN